ncbi:MAG: hypothetical protein Q9164_001817 [Protoblastenia rupestris]
MECREEGYLYIKIDDDMVFIGKNTIRHLVAAKEAHPGHLLVSANLIDSPVSTPIHDRMGSIKSYLPESTPLQSTSRPSWRASELPQWNGPIDFSIAKRSSEPVTKHRWLPLGPHDLARTPIKKRSWSRYKAKLAIWTVAAQEHYSFLENLEQMRLERYFFKDHPHGLQQMSTTVIAIWGDVLRTMDQYLMMMRNI